MSLEFYIGDIIDSITDIVAEVVNATKQGVKAVGKMSVSAVVGTGRLISKLVRKVKTEYNKAKVDRELTHKELERLLNNVDLSVGNAEKWIEKRNKSVYVYDEFDFDVEQLYVRDLAKNLRYMPEEFIEEINCINAEFDNAYDLTPKKRQELVERTVKLRESLEDGLRRDFAVIKTIIGKDFNDEEMENVTESMIKAIKEPEFYESIKKLLNYVQEADEADVKCKHVHHYASELIDYILGEESQEEIKTVVGKNLYEENIEVGKIKDNKKQSSANVLRKG